ncbi:MAG: hypothetical protein ACE5JB_02920 [bacterium]
MEQIMIKIPKDVLIEILRNLSKKDLKELLLETNTPTTLIPTRVNSESLDQLTGIISMGGERP